MKILLAGHEYSKRIIPASSYLIAKYLDFGFDVRFLNFGTYNGAIFSGIFESMAPQQDGEATNWGLYISDYLKKLTDEFVIFTLDDYFIYDYLKMDIYTAILFKMKDNKNVVCGRLCASEFYIASGNYYMDGDFIVPTSNSWYTATAQYCIWRRDYLIELLLAFPNPWKFEVEGSFVLNRQGKLVIGTNTPALLYGESSCLSKKWPDKIKTGQMKDKDLNNLVKAGHLKLEEIIT